MRYHRFEVNFTVKAESFTEARSVLDSLLEVGADAIESEVTPNDFGWDSPRIRSVDEVIDDDSP